MTDRICSVDGCERPHCARGWCKLHYYKLRPQRCIVPRCDGVLQAQGYCQHHRREFSELARRCPECDVLFKGHSRRKYCSTTCKTRSLYSPMRKAVEARDPAAVLLAAFEGSTQTNAGCWEWQAAVSLSGYAVIGQGGMGGLVHRHVMEAVLGRPLGLETVHHKCANRKCVNPAHLVPVTQHDNMAEMLARQFYLQRIAALEAALEVSAPGHPLLQGK